MINHTFIDLDIVLYVTNVFFCFLPGRFTHFLLLGIETWISTRNGIPLGSFNLSKNAKVISTGSQKVRL